MFRWLPHLAGVTRDHSKEAKLAAQDTELANVSGYSMGTAYDREIGISLAEFFRRLRGNAAEAVVFVAREVFPSVTAAKSETE